MQLARPIAPALWLPIEEHQGRREWFGDKLLRIAISSPLVTSREVTQHATPTRGGVIDCQRCCVVQNLALIVCGSFGDSAGHGQAIGSSTNSGIARSVRR
jgi:hypothetical protein